MIEILVAVGIIVILLGIVAFSVNAITSGARERDTRARLESLNGMFTEYRTAAGVELRKQPNRMYYMQGSNLRVWTVANDGPFDIWRDADPSDDHLDPKPDPKPLPAPRSVTVEDFTSSLSTASKDRFRSQAVHNTQLVMGLILTVAPAADMLGKLPQNAQLTNPNRGGTLNMGSLTFAGDNKSALKPPILVDAWDNPIIFVPASGLGGVLLKDHPGETHVITSVKVIEPGGTLPPNRQPFWASAGPDGSFENGDDNVYSFEN